MVWRLTTSTGSYAVKETRLPLSDQQAASAYRFQRRAEAYGVHAPRQLLAGDGQVLVRVSGDPIRLYDWVDLHRPNRGLDAHVVGRLLARLHAAGASLTQPDDTGYVAPGEVDPWFNDPVGRAGWESLVAQLEEAGAPFAADVAELVDGLVDIEAILGPSGGDQIVCHRDLWADNVRALIAGGEPMVIDWDNHGRGSASQELAMVLVEFGTTADRVRALYRSYTGSGGAGRITTPADFTMPVAVLNHILELGCRQWLAATDDEQRAHAAVRVAEFVGDPVTLPVVERLLAEVLGS